MKVETPQILWNSEGDKGINAALNSVSMLESGFSEHADDQDSASAARRYGHVMVTAGNTQIINLWRLSFAAAGGGSSSSAQQLQSNNRNNSGIFQTQNISTKIEYLCSLTRQEQAVNTVAFSPDGLHLATGGETGAIVVWSVPPSKRGNGNGRHYWSTVTREQDLNVRIVSRSGEGVCDISWSADSKRFIAGTIDHSVFVCEDKHYDNNHAPGNTTFVDSEWQVVFRNSMDHSQYVQGVAYDPLGVYLASMGSDRTVRVYPRKTPPKSKKKVLRPANNNSSSSTDADCNNSIPPLEHQRMVDQLLTESKLEITKSKLIKYRRTTTTTSVVVEDTTITNDMLTDNTNQDITNQTQTQQQQVKRHLYADESTLESFFRRLSWTTDGAFLVTPAALWHAEQQGGEVANNNNKNSPPSFATYLFARHKFDEPYKVLSGLEKPSVVVRPNPVLFQLPQSNDIMAPTHSASSSSSSPAVMEISECKENQSPSTSTSSRGLPYRSVFAVLTMDSILVYDTHHSRPLSVIRGLHYAGLSDCQWSADGMKLVVCSIDGYISIVTFENGELGQVYQRPQAQQQLPLTTIHGSGGSSSSRSIQSSSPLAPQSLNCNMLNSNSKAAPASIVQESPKIPPCEPGQSATLEAPPSKRSKKTRIAPTLVSAPSEPATTTTNNNNNNEKTVKIPSDSGSAFTSVHKRPADDLLESETENVGQAVTKMTLNNNSEGGGENKEQQQQPKKKKRIQPMLMSN